MYGAPSGYFINRKKSTITFNPNSSHDMKNQILSTLCMNHNESHELYLGLPSFSGRNKQRMFDNIRERVWSKLQGWKGKLFSVAGREILIKAVAQAIPSYTMSIFRLPVTFAKALKSMIVDFWWGATAEEKRIHWRKWKLLCRSKAQGGMGFRDFISFNQSLLAKQAWRILTDPNSHSRKIFEKKYFPSTDFLKAKLGHNPSFVWIIVLWGRELLIKGLRWRIANGDMISVSRDPWLLRPKHFMPISNPNQLNKNLRVSDLMHSKGGWHWQVINNNL